MTAPEPGGIEPAAEGLPQHPGRDAAFDSYVVPEIPVMYRVALGLTGQPADAEDLVQDALMRAYRAVDRFDGRYPRAWLLTIVRNTHLNRLRKKLPVLLPEQEDGQAPEHVLANRGERAPSAEDVVVSAELEAQVQVALEALPRKYREVLTLVDLQGLSYQQAAEALDVPKGTIMSRLHRARARVRTALLDDGVVPSFTEALARDEGRARR